MRERVRLACRLDCSQPIDVNSSLLYIIQYFRIEDTFKNTASSLFSSTPRIKGNTFPVLDTSMIIVFPVLHQLGLLIHILSKASTQFFKKSVFILLDLTFIFFIWLGIALSQFKCISCYQLLIKLIRMLNQQYSPTNPDRVNPEFIGIAEKYSFQKRSRLETEIRRNWMINSLKFKMSVDSSLDKSLEEKKAELRRVSWISNRHAGDLQSKRQREEKRRTHEAELNTSAQSARSEHKRQVREAVTRMHDRKCGQRQQLGSMLSTLRAELNSSKQSRLENNKIKFHEAKEAQQHKNQTVNGFHKRRNRESLNNYRNRIDEETSIRQQFSKEISVIKNTIDNFDHRILKKKHSLYEVLDEISLYTLEPREVYSKCLPYFLRDSLTISNHSSRPSDLLLKGAKTIIKAGSIPPAH